MQNQLQLLLQTSTALLLLSTAAFAMTPTERETARFHLMNAYNEADLLIRNHISFARDVKRQEQDFKGLKVFERIPLTDNLEDLREQLGESARSAHIELKNFEVGKRKAVNTESIPKQIYSSDEYKIPPEKLVETIPLTISLHGDEQKIRAWITQWDDQILRIVEATGKIKKTAQNEFRIHAQTYRFTEVEYPELKPKDPILFLPAWARQNPDKFAQAEPMLWNYVQKTRAIYPESSQYLKFRQQYLMNDARLSFYLAKTTNPRTIKE